MRAGAPASEAGGYSERARIVEGLVVRRSECDHVMASQVDAGGVKAHLFESLTPAHGLGLPLTSAG